jgi:DNA repair photolyase
MRKTANTKPAHGTGEWAASNVNIQRGCEHDCAYCYAKAMAVRFHRTTPARWKKPRATTANVGRRFTKRGGRIMFPSSHDITPENVDKCVAVLKAMLSAGNEVLIVSKPDPDCISRLCKELKPFRARVLFRFTIGSADDAVLKYWEPGAPSFSQRLAALKHAFKQGYGTSVSCEPMLDEKIGAVIDAVRAHVTDAIWLGKANRIRQMVALNSPGNKEMLQRASALVAMQNDEAIGALYARFKNDPLIKWKDSIKKIAGITRPTRKGLDV